MKGIIIFIGTTGAGKTTHAKILAEKTGATYISSGDIARGFMDAQTDELFKDGQLSPHETKIRSELLRKINASEVCILDGFPRVKEQLQWLSVSVPSAMYIIRLDWPAPVLVSRWVGRMRDAYDTLKTYIMRDDLYRRETFPLFKPDLIISHEFEQELVDVNNTIRKNVTRWLRENVPTFVCKDSAKSQAIDAFVRKHHVQFWHPDRTRTYAMVDEDVERELWRIVNA